MKNLESIKEKIKNNLFFRIGYDISNETGECHNYSILDKYYRYQDNVKSESTGNGRIYTSILWLSPEIAKKYNLPEKIEIKSGAIKKRRDIFYKEKYSGKTVLTEPYEVVFGKGENVDVLNKLLAGFFSGQCEFYGDKEINSDENKMAVQSP